MGGEGVGAAGVLSGGTSSNTGKESVVASAATESAIASKGRLSSLVGEAAPDVVDDEAVVAAKSTGEVIVGT